MSNRGGERRRSRSRSRGREPGREGGDNRDRRGDSRTRDDGFQDRRGGFQDRRGDDRGYQERRTDDRGYQDRGDGDRYSGSKRTREEGEEPEGPSRGFRGGDRDRGGRGFERDNRNTGGNSYGDRDDRGNGGRSYGDRDDRGGGGRGYGGGDRNNNDNGGRFGGGRGRGGFDGGRGRDGGRGGGGRGGRGGKKSMADVDAIVSLIKTGPNANDAACLKIIETPTDLKTREQHIENIEATGKHKYYKQPVEAWRLSRSLGISLDNSSHVVRGNCYRVNPQFLPPKIYHYYVSIFRFNRDGELTQEDLCKEKDATLCVGVVRNIIEKNPEWKSDINDKPIGLAYDGRSSLYSSTMIPFNMNGPKEDNLRWQGEINWPAHSPTTYLVLLSLAKDIDIPRTQEDWKKNKDMTALQALDIALISFAKWETAESHPQWIIAGSKVFKSDGVSYDFGKAYLGRLGYFFSLKACMAGLVLQTDVSVNCFAKGGKFIELMALIAGYSSVDEMARSTSNDSYGLQRDRLEKIEETLKNWKIRLLHVGHTKSFKRFGPPANHPDSQFTSEDGSTVTVAQYYQSKASNETYAKFLTGGKLKYPNLPTINAGNKNKQILIPVELVEIVPGQSKTTGLPSDISSNIIKYAAMLPADRFKYIDRESQKSGVLHELLTNRNTIAFGFDRIELTPIKSSAFILPPPKLQYKNRVIEPELKGAWNLAGGVKFIHPPPFNDNASNSSSFLYGIICVYRSGSSKPYGIDHMMDQFVQQLETESRNVGIPLQNCSRPHYVDSSPESLNEICSDLKKKGARIMVVLLHFDAYADVKYAADKLCLPSQCVRWKNVQTPPRNYAASLLVKMNYKMGGVNHTLTSRLPNNHDHSMEKEDCFQSPPKSISWLFDEPCMVIGLDINHPERGGPTSANAKTIISMVASMDGMMGQFAAHISVCHNKENPVNELERGISQLLTTFSHRNQGRVPRHILVYRDGVADNQFDEIVEKELVAFKNAYNLRGYDEGYVKMAIIVCQKRHHSRFVYDFGKGASEGDPEYLNPCVGLCIDGRCAYQGSGNGDNPDPIGSITSPNVNEFYLNSHAAILGTSKLCKYSLIYDEIGLEMVELELLTFWSTHLYCRCTKAVSCASPACYARFAAKRGGYLQRAGCSDEELAQMSENWLKAEQIPSVYFA